MRYERKEMERDVSTVTQLLPFLLPQTNIRVLRTGVRDLCRGPRPCKTPLPTLVFICPPPLQALKG